MTPKVGDFVTYSIHGGGYGVCSGDGWVIGYMAYAPNDVVLLAGMNQDQTPYVGCPMNKKWVTPTGESNLKLAQKLRANYVKEYGEETLRRETTV